MSSSLVWFPDSPDATGDAFEPSGSSEDLETDCSEAGKGTGLAVGVGNRRWSGNKNHGTTWEKHMEKPGTYMSLQLATPLRG